MQGSLEALQTAGIQAVGVSPDSVEILEKFSTAKKIGFPLLADAESKTIKAFGIHNTRGLPHPGMIVVDRSGVVQAKLFHEGFKVRHLGQELIDAVEKLAPK